MGNYLLTWDEVKQNNNNNFSGHKPKWFKHLEDNYILSNYRRLTYPLKDHYNIPKRLQKPPTKSLDTDTHSSITTMEHYIPLTNSSLNQISPNNSPRSIPLCLIPCPGCRLNDIYLTNYDTRVKCTINSHTDRLSTFNIYHMHSSSSEHKKYKNAIHGILYQHKTTSFT
ncbi:unnamed protein product [Rhizophagus irregularis]|nr:unnamed protein product [Rhizophagus irregularis]